MEKILIYFLFLVLIPGFSFAIGTVKIAVIMPVTGIADLTSRPLINTARFAVNEINQTGGVLRTHIKLVEFDNQSTPLGSKFAAEKAVKAGVIAVIGAIRSSNSIAMAKILQNAKIPMISPTSTNPALTLEGNYIFRVCFVDTFQGKVMANFAFDDLNAKETVVLTNTENRYCTGLAASFIKEFKNLSGNILWEGDYLEKISNFDSLVRKAGAFNPKVIFVPGYVKDSALIIRKARENGISSIFLGGDAWNDIMYDYEGGIITGSFYSTSWHPGSISPESLKFVGKYKKKFGKIKNYNLGLVYDAVMILKQAIQRGKSLDPRDIRDSLALIKDFKGVTGKIGFNKNGDPVNKSAVILKFQNNTSIYIKTVYSGCDKEL